jgi:predicted secreted protein
MFVQGYFATYTVAGEDIHVYSSSGTLTMTNETLDKTTLGRSERIYIPGLQDATLSMQMHLDTAGITAIQAAYASTTPVTFSFRPGKVGGPDAGQWDGTAIVTDVEITGSVDDNWQMNLSMQGTGPLTYTQPA